MTSLLIAARVEVAEALRRLFARFPGLSLAAPADSLRGAG
ncbi:hypothetical protein HD597_003006 [Nonomuraea thailandensis]|uniref:Uncharacterized protein n=1 Tax=Nonomuraea thailandensis TaxID=1188745 RepID=A0A9X2GBK5_9ACTN|nr:cytochrome P450 [Nonomuraea thailandensis]MCP2355986.1 hypothetical protein [Nonomuraea thailandensis]